MYTKRELPFLIARSKPVISSTVPANNKIGSRTLPLIIGVIALILFLGRR